MLTNPDLAPGGFVVVATYDFMPSAHIALGRLQAEGIEAFLADENLVQTDWLYSIAVGGIKLCVKPQDKAGAEAILSRDDSAMLEQPFSSEDEQDS